LSTRRPGGEAPAQLVTRSLGTVMALIFTTGAESTVLLMVWAFMTLLPPETAAKLGQAGHMAELFFDLVFVFAVTQVSALLHADHTWAGMGRALVVFVPIYWAWWAHRSTPTCGTSTTRRPARHLRHRAVQPVPALAVPDAFGERGLRSVRPTSPSG